MNDLFRLEVEDACALIKNMGADPNAFNFERQGQMVVRDGYPTRCYTVIVDFNGQRLHYQGGYGLDWVGHLEFDLCRGLFGRRFNRKE